MTKMVPRIRRRLHQAGWTVRAVKLDTLGGGELWLVRARRNRQSFSASGESQKAAWIEAWRLAKQLHATAPRVRSIIPFPRVPAISRRAG